MPNLYYGGLIEESLPSSYFGSGSESDSGSIGGSSSKIKFGSWYSSNGVTYDDIDEDIFGDIDFNGGVKFNNDWGWEFESVFDEPGEIEETEETDEAEDEEKLKSKLKRRVLRLFLHIQK